MKIEQEFGIVGLLRDEVKTEQEFGLVDWTLES